MLGAHSTEKVPFSKLIVNFFLKGVAFMFWHDIVYIEFLYCVTNFEVCIFVRFKVNCEVMSLRSFANFKLVLSRHWKEMRGAPKSAGP